MSHTLHRLGRSKDLKNDWIVFAMSAKGINKKGSVAKLRKFLKIALSYQPVNYGDMRSGSSFRQSQEDILENIQDESIVHAVFSNRKNVSNFLKELKSKDLGISVVLSGLLDGGKYCAKDAALKPHTVSLSLGIWGRRELLPERPILEMTTMCGHGLISSPLVRKMAEDMVSGELTIQEAIAQLAKPCVCGVFNPTRASELLSSIAKAKIKKAR